MERTDVVINTSVESFGQVRIHIEDSGLEREIVWIVSARTAEEIAAKLADTAKSAWDITENQ